MNTYRPLEGIAKVGRATYKNLAIFRLICCSLASLVAGCSDQVPPNEASVSASGGSEAHDVIRLGYVERPGDIASAEVMRAVLDELGFRTELVPFAAADLWPALAAGRTDAMVSARLPVRHAQLYESLSKDVDNLGPNLDGLRSGLLVPGFVEPMSIVDLMGQGQRFGGRILGIEADADLMTATRRAIGRYGLTDFQLMASATPLMPAMLQADIAVGRWAVATASTPHWLFAEEDVRFLDDPMGVYGGTEQFITVVRKGLRTDRPDAFAVLDHFSWTLADLNRMMLANNAEGADPAVRARQWVAEHLDEVHSLAGR